MQKDSHDTFSSPCLKLLQTCHFVSCFSAGQHALEHIYTIPTYRESVALWCAAHASGNALTDNECRNQALEAAVKRLTTHPLVVEVECVCQVLLGLCWRSVEYYFPILLHLCFWRFCVFWHFAILHCLFACNAFWRQQLDAPLALRRR